MDKLLIEIQSLSGHELDMAVHTEIMGKADECPRYSYDFPLAWEALKKVDDRPGKDNVQTVIRLFSGEEVGAFALPRISPEIVCKAALYLRRGGRAA